MRIQVRIDYTRISTKRRDELEFWIDSKQPDAAYRAMKRNWPVSLNKLDKNDVDVHEVELACGDESVLFTEGSIYHVRGLSRSLVGDYMRHYLDSKRALRSATVTDALYGELMSWMHSITHQNRIDGVFPGEKAPISFVIDTGPVQRGTPKSGSNWPTG